MLAQMLYPNCTEENHHTAQPRKSRRTNCHRVAERFALVREQDDQEERQGGRERD
jgi:hypothetical protein